MFKIDWFRKAVAVMVLTSLMFTPVTTVLAYDCPEAEETAEEICDAAHLAAINAIHAAHAAIIAQIQADVIAGNITFAQGQQKVDEAMAAAQLLYAAARLAHEACIALADLLCPD